MSTRLVSGIALLVLMIGVAGGLSLPAISAQTPGSISGVVTGAGGVALSGVQVEAYKCRYSGVYCDYFSYWDKIGTTSTGADGSYTISGLAAGNYRVAYRNGPAPWNYLWEVYPNTATTTLNEWKAAIVGDGVGDVVVGDGVAVTGIDASLVRMGHVTGVVTNAQTGLPASGISVVATGAVSPWTWTPPILRTDITDAAGRYDLWLFEDTYGISFAPGWGSTTDYFAVAVAGQAVTYGDELTLDQALQPAATISGTVTDGGGIPLSNVQVSTTGRNTFTAADGSYELTYLQPGSYTVQFRRTEYVIEWYDNASDETGATSLSLGYGDAVAGIDAVLTRAGAISGTIIGEDGSPLQGMAAYAYANVGGVWTVSLSGYSDSNGNYTIVGLPTGNYRVWFLQNAGWFGEYYDDVATIELGLDVATVNETVTPNIDAVLSSRRGSIGGVVTDSASVGLDRVEVQAYQCSYYCSSFNNNWKVIGSAYTATDGSYTIGDLPAGSYRVTYTVGPAPWHYLREVYPELAVTSNSAWGTALVGPDAAAVAVGEAEAVTGIRASLVRLGHVTGVATDDRTGLPIEGLAVIAEGTVPTWTWWPPLNRTDVTDAAGRYDLWLHPDDYQITFRDQGWVGNTNYFGITVPQSVAYEDEVTLDVTLVPTAKISGRVVDAAGDPIANVDVRVGSRSAWTDWNGTYTIAPLDPGTYTVRFSHYYYVTEWYHNMPTELGATTFTVEHGDLVTGVDAVLVRAGEITGHVAGDDGTSGLYNISVTAWASDGSGGWTVAGAAHTSGDGDYRILGLPTGNYRIQFQQSADWFGEYYDDVATIGDASDVATVNERVTPNIDASLRSRRGSISGTVTDADGVGIGGVNVEVWRCGNSWLCDYQNYWTPKGSTLSAADGTYEVGGLVALDFYRVVFRTNTIGPLTNFKRLPYLEEVYPELPVPAGSSWSATMRSSNGDLLNHVSVGEGADTGGINASLVRLARVSGVVTGERTGEVLAAIAAQATGGPSGQPPNLWWYGDGNYELWLHGGTHTLRFFETMAPTTHWPSEIPFSVEYEQEYTLDVALAPMNTPPEVGPIDAPLDPVSVETVVHASATFTDPDTLDSHTATWDWGDGSSEVVLVEPTGTRSTASTHVYTSAGVYGVTLRVTDDFGTWDESVFEFVVAYDAEAGFVTGGGWIDSPTGAYTPEDASDTDVVGRATFGFVSRYRRGATVPSGNTDFRFRAADFNFHSEDYQWLVVGGARAQFKGTGVINGAGDYGFLLTAVDGDLPGGGGVERFRIKIWDVATDIVVYDNQAGSDDGTPLATAIGGGSIVIHR
ncbi:MAG: hypothetical protein HOH95_07445 [Dehalococcoidia bacterium]|nr:hypothetical protein [Dehalococcoidia bacterium]